MKPIERNLRIAGCLTLVGLGVTLLSLAWKAPLSFILFAGVGVVLTLAGIVTYLYSLVSATGTP